MENADSQRSSPRKYVPVICRLSPASLDDLARIEEESNRAPWCRKFFAHEFQNSFSKVYGARVSGVLVAFIVMHIVADEAHIVNFAVAPGFRRRGIGRALMIEVLDELYCQGTEWVYLEVRAGNEGAALLYGSLGFVQVGVRKKYYSDNGEDALLMTLNLRELNHAREGIERRAEGF